MKKRFLELVNEVKETGVVEALYVTSNAEELKKAWRQFADENQELFEKIKQWANEFKETSHPPIFKIDDELENPMEICVVIFIFDDIGYVSEKQIFENFNCLVKEIKGIRNDFARTVEYFARISFICKLEAEEFFIGLDWKRNIS